MLPVVVLYTGISFVYLGVFCRGQWLLNPVPLFVVAQFIMFAGVVPLLNLGSPADVAHLNAMCFGLISFIAGALAIDIVRWRSRKRLKDWWKQELLVERGHTFGLVIWTSVLISAAVTAVYYYVLGYNLFLTSLSSFIDTGKGVSDIASLRLAAYSGDRYLAPGYVNQFKNMLLPLATIFLGLRAHLQKRRLERLIVLAVLVPACVIGLLGTGQRGAFIMVGLVTLVAINAALPRLEAMRVNVAVLAALACLVILSTVFLGRTIHAIDDVKDVGHVFLELFRRISYDQQIGAVVGFRYIYEVPVQWGREWLMALLGVLPSFSGSMLSHEIYYELFGTSRGTAPISIWGSIWHNFGPAGIAIVPAFIGATYQWTFLRLTRRPRTLFNVITQAALSVILGLWVSDGPMVLLNTGIAAVIGLRLARRCALGTLKPRRRLGSGHETSDLIVTYG